MKIIQVLTSLTWGDAIGNHVVALRNIIKEMGYQTTICVERADPKIPSDWTKGIEYLEKLGENDILIYHLSTGTPLNYKLARVKCKKVLIYHNITPPRFYVKYDHQRQRQLEMGYMETEFLADKFDYCIAVSEFNKQCLISMGYNPDKISVFPVIVEFNDYQKEPDLELLEELRRDDWVDILFVGRVATNKALEDAIRCFAYYKKNINAKSRLIFAGKINCNPYYRDLQDYAETLGVSDVIFTGGISFEKLLAYYRRADIFLCMSEYEGLCVPLLEAMYFQIPIIAYSCSAIPYTLGNSGVLVEEKDPVLVSKIIDRIVSDDKMREVIIKEQDKQLENYSYQKLSKEFVELLQGIIRDIEKNKEC